MDFLTSSHFDNGPNAIVHLYTYVSVFLLEIPIDGASILRVG